MFKEFMRVYYTFAREKIQVSGPSEGFSFQIGLGTMLAELASGPGQRSSGVEQRFRKPQVKGSNPFAGSIA